MASMLADAGISEPAEEALAILGAANASVETSDLPAKTAAMVADRAAGTPLAYVTGRIRFMGVDLLAGAGALVPRAETELLGFTALQRLRRNSSDRPPRLIDMCCGVGNLACGIAANRPDLLAWACDVTDGAVRVARANVDKLQLADRVNVHQSDLFGALAGLNLEQTIDVVVCNPPYISTGKLARERADLLTHEPREAFDGGPYGVNIFQRVVRDALAFLKPGATLLLEIGVGQERQVTRLFERTERYEPVCAFPDAAGRPRVVAADVRR